MKKYARAKTRSRIDVKAQQHVQSAPVRGGDHLDRRCSPGYCGRAAHVEGDSTGAPRCEEAFLWGLYVFLQSLHCRVYIAEPGVAFLGRRACQENIQVSRNAPDEGCDHAPSSEDEARDAL